MPLSITRKKSRRIMLGGVAVGDGAPITVQSMTNTKTDNVEATVEQIQQLTRAGCEIVRVAVPDQAAADALADAEKSFELKPLATYAVGTLSSVLARLNRHEEAAERTWAAAARNKGWSLPSPPATAMPVAVALSGSRSSSR